MQVWVEGGAEGAEGLERDDGTRHAVGLEGRLARRVAERVPDRLCHQAVAKIAQFGVCPDLQGTGVGSALMERVEARARELGATVLAGDTAEPARHLIAFYEKRGYEIVGRANWDVVHYESVIMAKPLATWQADEGQGAHDAR